MTAVLEKAVLEGFEESVHLENTIPNPTLPMSLNFATLFVQK
jgi:hypothetical protein